MSPPPRPPIFPYEILALIVLESVESPSTLAAWCGVSSAMVELAGPLLYERVELKRDDQWTAWFLDAAPDPHHPTLVRFLSIHQLRHLILSSPPPPSLYLGVIPITALTVPTRINALRTSSPASFRLALPTLEIHALQAIAPNYPPQAADLHPNGQLAPLLGWVDPQRLVLRMEGIGEKGLPTFSGERNSVRVDVALSRVVSTWRALREVEVTGLSLIGRELLFVTNLLQVRPLEARPRQSFTLTLRFTHPLPPPSATLWITASLRTRFERDLGEASGLKSVEGIRLFFSAELTPGGQRLYKRTVRDAVEKIDSGTVDGEGKHKVGVFVYWTGRQGGEEWCRADEYEGDGAEDEPEAGGQAETAA